MFVFTGWTMGAAFVIVAVIKVILPNNVGVFTRNGAFVAAGALLPIPAGTEAHPVGYWVIPVALAIGLGILVGTQRASRRILSWMRSRRPPAWIAVRVDVMER